MNRTLTDPMVTSFREDDPRPPVPGEEGETTCHHPSKLAMMRPKDPVKTVMADPRRSTTRRDEDGLGEPEGSASRTPLLPGGPNLCTSFLGTRTVLNFSGHILNVRNVRTL